MKGSKIKQICLLTLFNVAVAIISVVIVFFTFINAAITNQAEAEDMLSVYEETQYDYEIKNPSEEQITQFTASNSTDKVVPYYSVVANFNLGGEQVELSMLSVDESADVEYTVFSSKRTIKSGEVEGNAIYIDYYLAKRYGLSVGSQISAGQTAFTVAAIYKANDLDVVFVPNLTNIFNTDFSYGGVYVKTANKQAFRSAFLTDYKPLATLLGRDSFSSDAAYDTYLQNFNSRDYSSYIINKADGYEQAAESKENLIAEINSQYIIGAVIVGAMIFISLVFSALIFIKKIKTEVADGGRKSVLVRYAIAAVMTAIAVIVAWLVACAISVSAALHYITIFAVLVKGWYGIVIPVLCAVMGCVVDVFIIGKYKGKSRKKAK